MPAPSTPEARNLHREVQALIEQAAVQRAESSALRIRQQGNARGDGAAQGGEPSVHAGEAAGRPANPGRTLAKERLLDTRRALDGDAGNVINARRTSKADARAAAGYHPRRGGLYDSDEDRSPTPEPPGTRVFSREIRAAAFPPTLPPAHDHRQVQRGDGSPRVSQRLPPSMPAGRGHQRRGHHPQLAPTPRRFSPDMARAPARKPDPQLG
jgi:hypothetical protein